ncbi:hypothetical protein HYU16_05065 [Candidatus Woesearchaeota archaeon]|nr:hypothetical protein [Candidatus Woesearchaeota archaeon]
MTTAGSNAPARTAAGPAAAATTRSNGYKNGNNGNHQSGAADLTGMVLAAKPDQEMITVPIAYVTVPWNPHSTALADRLGLTIRSFYPEHGPPGEQARQDYHAALFAPEPIKVLVQHIEAAGYNVERDSINWVRIPNPLYQR